MRTHREVDCSTPDVFRDFLQCSMDDQLRRCVGLLLRRLDLAAAIRRLLILDIHERDPGWPLLCGVLAPFIHTATIGPLGRLAAESVRTTKTYRYLLLMGRKK